MQARGRCAAQPTCWKIVFESTPTAVQGVGAGAHVTILTRGSVCPCIAASLADTAAAVRPPASAASHADGGSAGHDSANVCRHRRSGDVTHKNDAWPCKLGLVLSSRASWARSAHAWRQPLAVRAGSKILGSCQPFADREAALNSDSPCRMTTRTCIEHHASMRLVEITFAKALVHMSTQHCDHEHTHSPGPLRSRPAKRHRFLRRLHARWVCNSGGDRVAPCAAPLAGIARRGAAAAGCYSPRWHPCQWRRSRAPASWCTRRAYGRLRCPANPASAQANV